MVDAVRPSHNPANGDTMTGMLREVLRKHLQSTDDMLPCRILAYDRATNRARVQVLIQVLDTEGGLHSRAEVPSVPVLLLGAGSFFVGFHLPPGTLGWLKAADRDIATFLQQYAEAGPGSSRLHTFEDSLFIPDVMTGYTIDTADTEAMVIQNLAGDVRIALDATGVRITSPSVTITTGASTTTFIDGQVTVNADLQVNGTIDATGTITSDTDVVGAGVSLSTHTHAGSPTAPSGPVSPTGTPN